MDNSTLSLTMRPRDFSEVVGLRTQIDNLKNKLAEGVPRGFALLGPYGCGKCFARGTKVLLVDGTVKNAEDVVVGDLLMGPDSTPREVLSTTTGVGPLYDIVPTKGEPHRVNDAHILVVRRTGHTKATQGQISDFPLQDFLKLSKNCRHTYNLIKVGVDFPERRDMFGNPADLPVEPYFLGLWLGDGDSADVRITTADEEIVDYLENYAKKLGMEVNTHQTPGKCATATITSKEKGGTSEKKAATLQGVLRSLNLLNNKHIPHIYLTASREDRLQLLAGLLDSDGTRPKDSSNFSFSQKSALLCEQVAFLIRSLGLWANISYHKKRTQDGVEGTYGSVYISGDCNLIPVKVARKKNIPRRQIKNALSVGFEAVPAGIGEYFGFTLAGDGRFLLADFTITHNTTIANIIARAVQGWDFPEDLQPQVRDVNAANYRKIDNMRELARDADGYAAIGKYRVIILNEAQQLTAEAQQVLLAELEKTVSSCVWILTSTNPEKINQGVKDRCYTIKVEGLKEDERAALVARACTALNHTADTAEFLAALTKANVVSPRKILMAFELHHNGLTSKEAISAMTYDVAPEYFTVCMGVVFGQWEKPYTLPWMKGKDGSLTKFNGVGEQLKALEEHLKGKPKAAATTEPEAADDAEPDVVDEEDLQGKPDVARALRAIVAASLKNQVYKGGARGIKAAEAMHILAHCCSPNPSDTGLEFSATVAGLFRVNFRMQGKG